MIPWTTSGGICSWLLPGFLPLTFSLSILAGSGQKERPDTEAAWLSPTSISVISLVHPLPCLFLLLPILLYFPPVPAKSRRRAY